MTASTIARAADASFWPFAAVLLLVAARLAALAGGLGAWAASALALFLAVAATKALSARERPDRSSRDSFPSGHAAAAAFLAASVAFSPVFATHRPSDRGPSTTAVVVAIVLAAWAAAVCWSRVALRRHHWTDVAAGAAGGLAFSLMAVAPAAEAAFRRTLESSSTYLGLSLA